MSFLDLFIRNNRSEKVRFLSLFSGIGAFEKALDNLEIPYELVGFSEIDKYAVKSYCAVHDVVESMNLGDITKIDTDKLPKDIDLITYGFPCQDISLAGKQKGMFNEDGTQTRSGLFFEALRIIETAKPRIAIAENVKNLTSKKFNAQFQIVLESLEQAGYNNYWQVLNAKDYGIPQNRERVFIISIRKDIDDGKFTFPEPVPLELRLKDMLDAEVDEKFFIEEKRMQIIEKNLGDVFKDNFIIGSSQKNAYVGDDSIAPSLTNAMGTGGGQTPMVKEMPSFVNGDICKTVRASGHGSFDRHSWDMVQVEPKVLIREATKKGYAEAVEGDSINLEQPNSKTRRGRVGKQVAQTLTTSPQQGVVINE